MNSNNYLKNIAGSNYEALILEMRKKVARNNFYEYCRLINPYFYREGREYLKEMCDTMQNFVENSEKQFLIINLPPRHGKSYTATNFTAWLLGRDNSTKIMTASYNETLSTEFAKQVRNTIDTKKAGKKLVYNDIFPRTKIKKGEASASLWALAGNTEKNYLATSPNGTCIGIGGKYIIVDDLLKNSMEAYNEKTLDSHWDWFTNTLMQRKEGEDWKVIIIMTRWVNGDLSGRLINSGIPYEHIKFKALQDDETMLCRQILNRKDYELTADMMNVDIFNAIYQQEPMDIAGRLYEGFVEYDELPAGYHKVYNQTDTADTGDDYLCSINYIVHNGDVYVLDVIYTQEPMEITEQKVAEMLEKDKVNEAIVESNNGGRGFARNVKKLMDNNRTVIRPVAQTKNKVSRILTASGWVSKHIFMPHNWKNKYREFAKDILKYQRKGKNLHDDACFTAGTMVATIFGDKPIETIKVGDKVLTPFGIKKVIDSRCTGIKEVIEKDGLIATPNHKIFDGNKFTELDAFTGVYDTIDLKRWLSWKYLKLLYLMAGNTLSQDKKDIILVNQQSMLNENMLKDCMLQFGNIIADKKYLKGISFIIKILIILTTTLTTWSVYHTLNMLKHTWEDIKDKNYTQKLWKWLVNGIKAKKVENGINNKLSVDGKKFKTKNLNVNIAEKNSNLHSQTLDSVANHTQANIEEEMANLDIVKYVKKISHNETQTLNTVQKNAKKSPEKTEVYNITVEDVHCFYANRKLVANCDVLSSIFEKVTGKLQPKILSKQQLGVF